MLAFLTKASQAQTKQTIVVSLLGKIKDFNLWTGNKFPWIGCFSITTELNLDLSVDFGRAIDELLSRGWTADMTYNLERRGDIKLVKNFTIIVFQVFVIFVQICFHWAFHQSKSKSKYSWVISEQRELIRRISFYQQISVLKKLDPVCISPASFWGTCKNQAQ